MIAAALIIFGLIALLVVTAAFWVQWWWFDSVGYRFVLVDRYLASALIFLGTAAVAGAAFLINVRIALQRSREVNPRGGRTTFIADRFVVIASALTGLVVAVFIGLTAASNWEIWALWWHSEPFGLDDPVFNRDVGFFIFALPALMQAVDLLLLLTLLCIAAVVVVYVIRLGVNIRRIRSVPALMRVHVLSLGGFLFLVIAVRQYLVTFELAYSTRGTVFGATYTDVVVQRPVNWLLAAIAAGIGCLLIANAFVQRVRWLIAAMVGWAALYIILGVIVPSAVQQTVVEPSELNRERPYIENHIAMTTVAYDLQTVEERDLTGSEPLTANALIANPVTMENIRLWDYRIIKGTYQQLQSFVPYYVFFDVDVDRYLVDGQIEQVLTSVREIDQSGLPETAQSWTNERLVYTHGYGLVVSQVAGVSPQGLPTFLVERIPPTGTGVYQVDRPEIYFGESTLGWVAVHTGQPEFSGLAEAETGDASPGYEGLGKGSIQLGNYFKKLLLSVHLRDRNLLLSGNITSESEVMMHRNIVDRVNMIAPFLELDPDPYMVIADGRLVWVIDAYTTSNLFPHAERSYGLNYVRNSVKVTIDAYDGTVTFYRTNEEDPIADAYGRLYDGLFTSIEDAPASISYHFRYPEQLFEVQSDIYASVHVEDADRVLQRRGFLANPDRAGRRHGTAYGAVLRHDDVARRG